MIIIAILLAVAIPLFLSSKTRAMATTAKANASLAWKAEVSCSVGQNGEFEGGVNCATVAEVVNEEDGLSGTLDCNGIPGLQLLPSAGHTCVARWPVLLTQPAEAHFIVSATKTIPPVYFAIGIGYVTTGLVGTLTSGRTNSIFKKCFLYTDVAGGTPTAQAAKLKQQLCPTGAPGAMGDW